MGTAYAENREVHQLCCSLFMIANRWEGEKYSVKSGPWFRYLAGVFQGTSMDCCSWAGKLLAHVPPRQQFWIREWGCPGEVKVIREVSSKKCEIFLSCVSHIQTINVSCLKSEAKEVGKPRKSWQSVRLCLWQQSKETVNPALQLLPPAETATATYCKARSGISSLCLLAVFWEKQWWVNKVFVLD